jgi:hypothetical protein
MEICVINVKPLCKLAVKLYYIIKNIPNPVLILSMLSKIFFSLQVFIDFCTPHKLLTDKILKFIMFMQANLLLTCVCHSKILLNYHVST